MKNLDLKIHTIFKNFHLNRQEQQEVSNYIHIYLKNKYKEHYEVNAYISKMNLWDNFQTIRAYNDHGTHVQIKGILPKYYAVVCKILDIKGAGGKPLDSSSHY